MQTADYVQQDRGDLQAYARYLANMDAAMRQKVGLPTAFLSANSKLWYARPTMPRGVPHSSGASRENVDPVSRPTMRI